MKSSLIVALFALVAAPVYATDAPDAPGCSVQVVDSAERPLSNVRLQALVLAGDGISRLDARTNKRGVAEFGWSGTAVQAVVLHDGNELGRCLAGHPRKLRLSR